jgi:molybdate transport system substrate-binding protein
MTDSGPVRILSADAPKVGLRQCAELFSSETGEPHEIELATGPVIKERVAAGTAEADIIVIPRSELEDLASAGLVDQHGISTIGTITVGVTVKNGAREPDISSLEAFILSVLAADRIIYNTASSGQYVAAMFERLQLADKIRHKALVVPTGVAAMEALAADTSGSAIGFGHVTEIRRLDHLGTHLVGPLPGEIGRSTPYAAGVASGARRADAACRLVDFLTSPRAKQIFVDSGVQ